MWSGKSEPVAADAAAALSPMALLQEAIAAAMLSESEAAQATETATTEAIGDAPSLDMIAAEVAKAVATMNAEGWTGATQNVAGQLPPAEITAPAPLRVATSAKAAEPLAAPTPIGKPTFASFKRAANDVRPRRGISVHFRDDLARLMARAKAAEGGKMTLLKRVAVSRAGDCALSA